MKNQRWELEYHKIQKILVLLLLLSKILYYHGLMEVKNQFFIVILVSASFLLVMNYLFQKKTAIWLFLYMLISLLMFVDVLYFKYFNQVFSVSVLGQAAFLGDVSDVVFRLVQWKEILLLLDLPIFFVFQRFHSKDILQGLVKNKRIFAMIALMNIIFLGWNVVGISALEGIKNQEFFTYHIRDLLPKKMEQEVSLELRETREEKSPKKATAVKEEDFTWGSGKGRDIFVIQVESLQNMLLKREYKGKEITPNINKLLGKDTFYFSRYYQQLGRGNTSDAEFVTHNSIYPSMEGQTYSLYQDNNFEGLPWTLKKEGYQTLACHGYRKKFWNREHAYPNQGFDCFLGEEDFVLDEKIGLGLSDSSFFRQVIEEIENRPSPLYGFFVTLTSHTPYEMPMEKQNIELAEEDRGTLFGNYIQSIHYTDQAIGEFIQGLKEIGRYENSVIVLYGDHFGINSKEESARGQVTSFLGREYDFEDMMNIPLIIHIPNAGMTKEITRVGGQVDFYPTFLHVLGLRSTNPYILGQNLFLSEEGFVASQTYMVLGSFITDAVVFEMSRDGIFEHSRVWDISTKEKKNPADYREYYQRALQEIQESNQILKHNLLAPYCSQ